MVPYAIRPPARDGNPVRRPGSSFTFTAVGLLSRTYRTLSPAGRGRVSNTTTSPSTRR